MAIFAKNQISANFMYIENNATLPILQISNGYHKSFQIVDYTMTHIKNFSHSKIVDFVPEANLQFRNYLIINLIC